MAKGQGLVRAELLVQFGFVDRAIDFVQVAADAADHALEVGRTDGLGDDLAGIALGAVGVLACLVRGPERDLVGGAGAGEELERVVVGEAGFQAFDVRDQGFEGHGCVLGRVGPVANPGRLGLRFR